VASVTTRVSPSRSAVGHLWLRSGHRRERPDLLLPCPPHGRQPHTAHQFGVADIQGCDPRDDLLLAVVDSTITTPYTSKTEPGKAVARGGCPGRSNLVRVLEATLKDPCRNPRRPTIGRPPRPRSDDVNGRPDHHLHPRTGPATAGQKTKRRGGPEPTDITLEKFVRQAGPRVAARACADRRRETGDAHPRLDRAPAPR